MHKIREWWRMATRIVNNILKKRWVIPSNISDSFRNKIDNIKNLEIIESLNSKKNTTKPLNSLELKYLIERWQIVDWYCIDEFSLKWFKKDAFEWVTFCTCKIMWFRPNKDIEYSFVNCIFDSCEFLNNSFHNAGFSKSRFISPTFSWTDFNFCDFSETVLSDISWIPDFNNCDINWIDIVNNKNKHRNWLVWLSDSFNLAEKSSSVHWCSSLESWDLSDKMRYNYVTFKIWDDIYKAYVISSRKKIWLVFFDNYIFNWNRVFNDCVYILKNNPHLDEDWYEVKNYVRQSIIDHFDSIKWNWNNYDLEVDPWNIELLLWFVRPVDLDAVKKMYKL